MAKQIRLLLINTVRTTHNGQTMFLLNYLRHMDLSGMQVGFGATNHAEEWVREEFRQMGVKLHELPMRNRKPQKYVNALIDVIRAGEYNVVHAHGNSATLATEMFAAQRAGVPVRIAHSHNTRCGHPLIHKLLSPLMLNCTTARFACGVEAGKWLYGGRDFSVIRNASDAGRYAFDPAVRSRVRAEFGLEERTVIGAVGAFNEQKNPLFLLDAFALAKQQNPALHLMLVGDGHLRQQVEAKIAELDLEGSVTLTGRVNDVQDKMQAMDMMVLPSIYEGFPCVLVEWQLNGLRALVSDAVTRDCDMTGLLEYLALDMNAWAEKMAAAVPQNDRAKASADAAGKVAQAGYDIRVEAQHLKERYAQLLKEKIR